MPPEPMCMDLSPTIQRQFNRLKSQGRFENDQELMQAALKALDDVLLQNQYRQHPHPLDTKDPTEPYMSYLGQSPDDYDV